MTDTPTKLRIWQQNVNKSLTAQQSLINSIHPNNYDLILLQEPYLDHNRRTRANPNWRVVYPSSYYTDNSAIRAVILVNTKIDTNRWKQINIDNSDLVAIQITGDLRNISFFNVYNDC